MPDESNSHYDPSTEGFGYDYEDQHQEVPQATPYAQPAYAQPMQPVQPAQPTAAMPQAPYAPPYGMQAPMPYGQPAGYGMPGMVPYGASNGAATAALVLGIAALVCGTVGSLIGIGPFVAIPCGIAAAICGAIGIGKANSQGGYKRGMAIGGLVTGILGTILSVAIIAAAMSVIDDYDDYGYDDTTWGDTWGDDSDDLWGDDADGTDDPYGIGTGTDGADDPYGTGAGTSGGTGSFGSGELAGHWVLDHTTGADAVSKEDMEMMRSSGMDVTLDLGTDGTMTFEMFGSSTDGTWDGDATVTLYGQDIDVTRNADGTISLSQPGTDDIMHFRRG